MKDSVFKCSIGTECKSITLVAGCESNEVPGACTRCVRASQKEVTGRFTPRTRSSKIVTFVTFFLK